MKPRGPLNKYPGDGWVTDIHVLVKVHSTTCTQLLGIAHGQQIRHNRTTGGHTQKFASDIHSPKNEKLNATSLMCQKNSSMCCSVLLCKHKCVCSHRTVLVLRQKETVVSRLTQIRVTLWPKVIRVMLISLGTCPKHCTNLN